MDTPFGCEWEEVGADAIRAFLVDARKDEGLTWEAKSDDERGTFPRDKFREAVAAMANGLYVGYVLVGAAWASPGGPWSLVGLRQPPTDEITAWLDQLIDGVKPRPRTEIKPLQGDLGPGAIVQVLPLAVPPAITSGRLMVRTSGRTTALDDPGEIRRLIERGSNALERARTDAANAAGASGTIPFEAQFSPSVMTGLASTGRRDDVSREVFRKSFIDRLEQAFIPWEMRGLRRSLTWDMKSDRVAFWVESGSGSMAGALTTGAAFVTYWEGAARDEGLDLALNGLLARIWTFAGSIVTDLGGYGPSFAITSAHYPGSVATLERATKEPVPSEEEIGEGIRFLDRLRGGKIVFEPE